MKATDKIKSLIVKQNLEMLKEMAKNLMSDYTTQATLVFTFVMNEIEDRMQENEFIEFCDSL